MERHKNLLLALRMKVNAANLAFQLVEANVVKSLETGASYRPNSMVRD